MQLPLIDLFSGAGGVSIGMKQCGYDVRAAVEFDEEAIRTYKKNIGDIVIPKDISLVSGKELLNKANISKGEPFLLAGCPPCQGFSAVGPRQECDDRNQLVFQFIRLIKETEPWYILMENVPGMMNGIGKEIFNEAIALLDKKYLYIYEILNTIDYGVPQKRKRLVLQGIRKDVIKKYFPKNFKIEMPKITHSRSECPEDGLFPRVNVNIISDLPPVNNGEKHPIIPNHSCMKLSVKNEERIKHTSLNGGSRSEWPQELVLDCHKKNVGYKDVYGRMNMENVAPTITAGCLCYSKGRFGHPTQDRAITAREAARLQTFPDDFYFEGTLTSVSKQIGNAVPPKLAQASGKYLLDLHERYVICKIKK